MKRTDSSLSHPTHSVSASNHVPAAAASVPASLQTLPQELIDGVMDMAIRNHVPYREVAAVSSAFRQAALSHARRALTAAPYRVANGAPCLSQTDWLQLSQTHQWLRTTDTETQDLGNQLECLSPEAFRVSLEPWITAPPNMKCAAEAASRIVEAYRLGAPELNLSGLELATLPDSIGQLTALQVLGVVGNRLMTLPDSIGQLMALRQLRVGGNQLTALPDSIGQLTALQQLGVGDNQLTALPSSIGQLAVLKVLGASDNQLTTLPDSIGQLTALQMLLVDRNQLTTLPESIWQLAALQSFYVVATA